MEEELYWIWISRIQNIGVKKIQKLLEKFKKPEKIWQCTKEDLNKIEWLKEDDINKILDIKYRNNLEKYKKYLNENQIKLISLYDKRYPKKLKQIYDSPVVLYVKGNEQILNENSLAIIGCRENSKYGEIIARGISKKLTQNNIITISGLAKGIDCISQKETVENKGKTIAVLGHGLDIIYPKENEKLAKDIIKNGGALVSEYLVRNKNREDEFSGKK